MFGARDMHGDNLKKRQHLKYQSVNGRIILKWILKK